MAIDHHLHHVSGRRRDVQCVAIVAQYGGAPNIVAYASSWDTLRADSDHQAQAMPSEGRHSWHSGAHLPLLSFPPTLQATPMSGVTADDGPG